MSLCKGLGIRRDIGKLLKKGGHRDPRDTGILSKLWNLFKV